MTEQTNQPHISGEKARAGATPHVARYVLGASMILIIAIFALLFLR